VTKRDIVRTIAEEIDLPQFRTRVLVQRTFEALIEVLVRDGRVELRNFGVFQIKQREARLARNPRTGEPVPVEAKNVVTFRPGKEMEERVRQFRPADEGASEPREGDAGPLGPSPDQSPRPDG
jgi:integration host factor subunit beta